METKKAKKKIISLEVKIKSLRDKSKKLERDIKKFVSKKKLTKDKLKNLGKKMKELYLAQEKLEDFKNEVVELEQKYQIKPKKK